MADRTNAGLGRDDPGISVPVEEHEPVASAFADLLPAGVVAIPAATVRVRSGDDTEVRVLLNRTIGKADDVIREAGIDDNKDPGAR
jgi:hypothetical protein